MTDTSSEERLESSAYRQPEKHSSRGRHMGVTISGASVKRVPSRTLSQSRKAENEHGLDI